MSIIQSNGNAVLVYIIFAKFMVEIFTYKKFGDSELSSILLQLR